MALSQDILPNLVLETCKCGHLVFCATIPDYVMNSI